jgi:Uncharacterized protein conserved in bacteria
MPNAQSRFFLELHYFRAFAIVNIFFIHVWRLPSSKQFDSASFLVAGLRELAFHGSTIYFLFISGFLFFFLASKTFSAQRHYWRKFKYVVVPYIIWSLIALLVSAMLDVDHRLSSQPNAWEGLKTTVHILLNGNAVFVFWFIPVIVCLFIISPFFLKLSKRSFTVVVAVAGVLPLLGTRTGADLSVGQFLYFAPSFLFGGWVFQHYERFQFFIRRYKIPLLSVFVISSFLIVYVTYYSVSLPYIKVEESLFYIQKMAATCFVIYLLLYARQHMGLVDLLAKFSFAIYFTHYVLYMLIAPFFFDFLESRRVYGWGSVPLSFFFSLFLLMVDLAVCVLLKKVFGRYSRVIIGS